MQVTVCIPTIPPRYGLLGRAVRSAMNQTAPPCGLSIAVDLDHEGHGPTRTRAVHAAETEWVAFLDDDDEMYKFHLERLIATQALTNADLVFPWFDVVGGHDPFPQHEGKVWSPESPTMFPVTVLVRRDAYLDVGGMDGESNSDWRCWVALAQHGFSIVHLPERTWAWHHDSGNTSGDGTRW